MGERLRRTRCAVLLVACAASLAAPSLGCATYLVRERDFSASRANPTEPVIAIREADDQPVQLQPGSFQLHRDPAPRPGMVRVRGGVGARKFWSAGAIATSIGATLFFIGLPLLLTSVDYDGEGRGNAAASLTGIVFLSFGGAALWVAGPALFLTAVVREARPPKEVNSAAYPPPVASPERVAANRAAARRLALGGGISALISLAAIGGGGALLGSNPPGDAQVQAREHAGIALYVIGGLALLPSVTVFAIGMASWRKWSNARRAPAMAPWATTRSGGLAIAGAF